MFRYENPLKGTPEYRAWIKMNRTYGSDVCVCWGWYYHDAAANQRSFTDFRRCVGPRPEGHVLIRLDKSQPFGPGNVRWGTHAESNAHRGPYKKFSYSRDEELIAELERRGYGVTSQKLRG